MTDIKPIIYRYIHGTITPEEAKVLYEWINESFENRKYLFQQKDLWDSLLLSSDKLNEIEQNQWIELHKTIRKPFLHNARLLQIIKIAAIVIISIGIGWLGHSIYSSRMLFQEHVELKQVTASDGQLKEVFLADGTHVWLNSGSSLSFPSGFNLSQRKVNLSGEAFFEVNANKDVPFYVITGNHTVKVTGTRFNVCEYPEDNIIETTLEEGEVKIITGNLIKDLHPGQQSSFNTQTALVRIGAADLEIYTTWKDGLYEFNNESVCKVFRIIERWWDVDINYPSDKLKDERITGILRKHKPLEQHFEVIRQLVPFNYKIEADRVTINLK